MKNNDKEALAQLEQVLEKHGNFYETCVIIAKRAKQIIDDRKESFYAELDSIGVTNVEDSGMLNKENWREAVYNKYDKMPKPIISAIQDIADEKVIHHYISKDKETESSA